MNYLLAAGLVLLNLFWLLLVVLGLPGNWLIVASTVAVAWWQSYRGADPLCGVPVLIAISGLALAAEIVEFVAGMLGAKAAGGTQRGAAGALLGALLGAVLGTLLIPLPVLGTLIGTCGGAAFGAWGFELSGGRAMGPALRSGVGAGVGRLTGTLAKLVIGAAICIIVAVAAFWP